MLLTLFRDAKTRNAHNRQADVSLPGADEKPVTAGLSAVWHARVSKVVRATDVPMAIIGVAYVFVYAIAVLYPNPIVEAIDFIFWAMFAIDLLLRFLVADSLSKFFLKNWLETLAVIVPQFRAVRAIRPIIGLKRFTTLVRSRSQRLAAYTVALLPLAVFVAAIAFMDVEGYGPERLSDALWWAMVTVSTVGFGDVIPATDGGRIVASILMVFGVGIFASAAAFIADWLQGEKASN